MSWKLPTPKPGIIHYRLRGMGRTACGLLATGGKLQPWHRSHFAYSTDETMQVTCQRCQQTVLFKQNHQDDDGV